MSGRREYDLAKINQFRFEQCNPLVPVKDILRDIGYLSNMNATKSEPKVFGVQTLLSRLSSTSFGSGLDHLHDSSFISTDLKLVVLSSIFILELDSPLSLSFQRNISSTYTTFFDSIIIH